MAAYSVFIDNAVTGESLTQVRLLPTSTVMDLRTSVAQQIEGRLQFLVGDVVLSDNRKTLAEYGIDSNTHIMATRIAQVKPLILRNEEGGVVELKADASVELWGNHPSWDVEQQLWNYAKEGYIDSIKSLLEEGVLSVTCTDRAFATLKISGGVTAWGHGDYGGDSSAVQDQLGSDVRKIVATGRAFAVLKTCGCVVSWGAKDDAGRRLDTTLVKDHLSEGAESLFAMRDDFLAFKSDGNTIQWGSVGKSFEEELDHEVKKQLATGVRTVHRIHASVRADSVVALTNSGSVIVLNQSSTSPTSCTRSNANAQLAIGVKELISGPDDSIAALKEDGSALFWGSRNYLPVGDDAHRVSFGVKAVYPNTKGWAILKTDGSIITWGVGRLDKQWKFPMGFSLVEVPMSLTLTRDVIEGLRNGAQSIYCTKDAFAVLKQDGAVVTWGIEDFGGNHSSLRPWWKFGLGKDPLAHGVIAMASTQYAFAALKEDGSVLCWGAEEWDFGPMRQEDRPASKRVRPTLIDTSHVSQQLAYGVRFICSSNRAFAAVKQDNAIVLWGDKEEYGLARAEAEQFLRYYPSASMTKIHIWFHEASTNTCVLSLIVRSSDIRLVIFLVPYDRARDCYNS